jgi:hypothetical protein
MVAVPTLLLARLLAIIILPIPIAFSAMIAAFVLLFRLYHI